MSSQDCIVGGVLLSQILCPLLEGGLEEVVSAPDVEQVRSDVDFDEAASALNADCDLLVGDGDCPTGFPAKTTRRRSLPKSGGGIAPLTVGARLTC